MTLQELYDAFTVRGLNRETLYLELPERLPTEPCEWVLIDSRVLNKYGERTVHDIFPIFEKKKIYISLKATNKEIWDAFMDGWSRDI